MAKKKVVGTCRLCGNHGELTFEHIPPQSADNSTRIWLYRAVDLWERQPDAVDLPRGGRQQQRGAGGRFLCGPCNHGLGSASVPEYKRWARPLFAQMFGDEDSQARRLLTGLNNLNLGTEQARANLEYRSVSPFLFARQCLAMCVVMDSWSRSARRPGVRDLLQHGTPLLAPDFSLQLGLYAGPYVRTSEPTQVLYEDLRGHFFSEIAFPPFVVHLTLGGTPSRQLLDITKWLALDDSSSRHVTLGLPILFGNSVTPGDFQSAGRALGRDALCPPGTHVVDRTRWPLPGEGALHSWELDLPGGWNVEVDPDAAEGDAGTADPGP